MRREVSWSLNGYERVRGGWRKSVGGLAKLCINEKHCGLAGLAWGPPGCRPTLIDRLGRHAASLTFARARDRLHRPTEGPPRAYTFSRGRQGSSMTYLDIVQPSWTFGRGHCDCGEPWIHGRVMRAAGPHARMLAVNFPWPHLTRQHGMAFQCHRVWI